MAVSLNTSALTHAQALIASGHFSESDYWSFTAEDANRLLGNDDWSAYAKWFLGMDASLDPKTKAAYSYPYSNGDGRVHRKALIAIRSYSGRNDENAIDAAAGRLLAAIDKKLADRHTAQNP